MFNTNAMKRDIIAVLPWCGVHDQKAGHCIIVAGAIALLKYLPRFVQQGMTK